MQVNTDHLNSTTRDVYKLAQTIQQGTKRCVPIVGTTPDNIYLLSLFVGGSVYDTFIMEITSITRSYSRKLNHAIFNGNQYESSDHFMSVSADIYEDDDIQDVSEQMREYCKQEVYRDISKEIQSLQGNVDSDVFLKYIRAYILDTGIDSSTYERMSPQQKTIIQEIKKAKKQLQRITNKDNE